MILSYIDILWHQATYSLFKMSSVAPLVAFSHTFSGLPASSFGLGGLHNCSLLHVGHTSVSYEWWEGNHAVPTPAGMLAAKVPKRPILVPHGLHTHFSFLIMWWDNQVYTISVQVYHLVETMKTTCKKKMEQRCLLNIKLLFALKKKYKVFGRLTELQCSGCMYTYKLKYTWTKF